MDSNSKRSDSIDTKRLGRWLKKFEKRVEGGLRFERVGFNSDTKVTFWAVKKVTGITGITGNVSNLRGENGNQIVNCISTDMVVIDTRNTRKPRKTDLDSDIEEF